MNGSDDGFKPSQTGLVDMGFNHFYDDSGVSPIFDTNELGPFADSFSEIVLNVTWAQLQATRGGSIDWSVIDSAIGQVNAFNTANGTDLGIKLRVWGGVVAPDWAKAIDGPAITVTGKATVDPTNYDPRTFGRVWSADYNDAWASLQKQLAAHYDGNSVIRGISQTAGATASDEPFVALDPAAPVSNAPGAATVNQLSELQAGGYTDAAEMLTLRAAIADYAQWSTTPLDYTINPFHLFDSGTETLDPNFALAVLQQTRNSSRLVQAGNHALDNPQHSQLPFLYGQLTADAALTTAAAPNSYQSASPDELALHSSTTYPTFTGDYSNWPNAVANGVAANGGNIELWDFSGPSGSGVNGFTTLTAGQAATLAQIVASGVAPTTGSPINGTALGFVAPAFATGVAGTISFTGVDAILLASTSASALTTYTVTLTSQNGHTLGVADPVGIVTGATSGTTLTFTGTLAQVNTVLASLTDTLPSGQDVVHIVASDSDGHSAQRDVGLKVGSSTAPSPATASTGPDAFVGNGLITLGGVESTYAVAGDLDIGSGGQANTLLAALASSNYSTATLTIGGALHLLNGGAAHFTGALSAPTVAVDSGGTLSGDGTVGSGSGTIANSGTIEAAADFTLGLQTLIVSSAVAGTGTLQIDAGATLILEAAVASTQTITFADSTIYQFSNGPYSPSTLILEAPQSMQAGIGGFTFADRLVFEGQTIASASYVGTTLTVNLSGGSTLSYQLTGDLSGLTPDLDSSVLSQGVIKFVAPTSAGIAPSVEAPATLQAASGVAVLVPDVVIRTPLPSSGVAVSTTISVTVSASNGSLTAGDDQGHTTVVTSNGGKTIELTGTLDQVERSLQTLAYTATASGSDTITVSVTDYAGTSAAPGTISVSSGVAPLRFDWVTSVINGSFGTTANWQTPGGSSESTPPGGSNVASFGTGTYAVSGDGAVGEVLADGSVTFTGRITAQGLSGVSAIVDSGGALTLAGGAVLTAQEEAVVGATGQGLLTVMGGALDLTGSSAAVALMIGSQAGSDGTVVNLENISANGTIVVGNSGSGTFDVWGVAASVFDSGATIGQSTGGQGSVTVNGGEWMNSGALIVGGAGTGTLLIDGSNDGITGQVTAYNATIGRNAGGHGTIQLDGGELLVANVNATSDTLTVGAAGTGDLIVENGSEVAVGVAQANSATNTGILDVGTTAGGHGQVKIGNNSTILVYGDGQVGGTGVGDGRITVGENTGDAALLALLGTLTIAGTGQITLGSDNAIVRASAIDIDQGGKISGSGSLTGELEGNHTVDPADIVNDGMIQASGGTLLLYGDITGTGTLSIANNATLVLHGSVGSGQTISFGSHSTVIITDPDAFAGTITGFGADDKLELGNSSATSVSWASNVLTVASGAGFDQLHIQGGYDANAFTMQSDGLGGTFIAASIPPVGGGDGDVHMTTFDGLHYDFQAVGEFVAVQGTDATNAWGFQIRTAPLPNATSLTIDLATMIGDHRVTLEAGRESPVYLDGMADTALTVGDTQTFAGGSLSHPEDNVFRFAWNGGESVTIINWGGWLDWKVNLAPGDGAGSVHGLLGSNSGVANTFELPDGTSLGMLDNDQILGTFANAWSVSPEHSLMDDHHAPDPQLFAHAMAALNTLHA